MPGHRRARRKRQPPVVLAPQHQPIQHKAAVAEGRGAGHHDGQRERLADQVEDPVSTAGGIMPVTVIDGQPVGTGAPGPLTLQLRDRYWASHEDPRYSTPVRYDEPD